MITNFYKTYHKLLWLILFVFCVNTVFAQKPTYKNGTQQGIVKVKFASTMQSSLKTMRVEQGTALTTGIKAFDAVSEQFAAKKMHRLFPQSPNERLEAKLHKHGLDRWYVVEVNSDEDPENIATAYRALGEVSYAEAQHLKVLAPYQVYQHSGVSTSSTDAPFNDPYLGDQWHYNNTGQTGYPDGSDINLFAAWATTAGSNDVIVSIHDQGVDINHPDLAANIWVNEAEYNGEPGVDDDNNGYIDDIHGWNFDNDSGEIDAEFHGTHVAGTIAAVNNNGYGVAGVAGGTGNNDGAKIMSLQMLNGGSIEETYIYAADNGSVISQNSWGYTNPYVSEESVREAIDYFIAEAGDYDGSPMKGGIVIFAAGNSDSSEEWYPGYYDEVLSVSAIGPNWQKASYSNYGTWVDIAAPGGETSLGNENGVLSTLPNEQVGYLQGTSMACPHVSGIAALVLANRTSQLTPQVLWNKLVTGVVDIDEANPDYAGKLGSGHIDAYLAIQNDEGIAPDAITDLSITGISQEFANLSWTVPADEDDGVAANFRIYHSTTPITDSNIGTLPYEIIENEADLGEEVNYTVEGLYGLTSYYFAVVSGDRWNNLSLVSNVVEDTTNEGPEIGVDEDSQAITIDIDAGASVTGTHDITILNNAEGVLRWDYITRHKSTSLSYYSDGLNYPLVQNPKIATMGEVGMTNSHNTVVTNATEPAAYTSKQKQHYNYVSNIIGDMDTTLTNSAATRFFVDDSDGFNLTHVQMYLKVNPATGPVIVEIHKGGMVNKQNTIYAQEYMPYSSDETYAYITLNEQLYFEQGETFWVVFHVPSGNLYPLGMGPEIEPEGSDNCFMSFDLGQSWAPMEDLIEDENYAWGTTAISSNAYLGEYLTLNPSSGEVAGLDQQMTSLTADASSLINGTYEANIILESNDVNNKELRLPVMLNVSGQVPVLKSLTTLDFGSVFKGTTKELTLTVKNTGLGNFNDMAIDISNPQFEVDGWPPSQIAAKGEINLTIKYTPGASGNDNGLLTLSSLSSSEGLQVVLFGVSTEPAAISIDPESQQIDDITIGDEVSASITVENTGQSALKYFVPGYDESGISDDWEGDFHRYGYKFRTNYASETSPIAYDFQDISSTGTPITDYFKLEDNRYYPINMGFDFPYYADKMDTLFISSKGFTAFDDDVNPINTPRLNGAPWSPKGYISAIGGYTDLSAGGDIYYQVDADKVIIQYSDVTDGYSGSMSAQIVLYANGNIRFFYNDITFAAADLKYYLNILIEDYEQTDGILIHDYENTIDIYDGLALGFDYPGPDIITAMTNAGGILLPGETATIDVTMDTEGLYEGTINRYVNIVSNDPFENQKIAQIQLNITDGGTADLAISTTDIDFGDVFQGATASQKFSIKNNGTAPATLTDFSLDNGSFTINGNTSAVIAPGLAEVYEVVLPTGTVANLTDVINITADEGGNFTVNLAGNVLDPPAITTDLSPIDVTLAYGETSQYDITFENPGLADLEVVASGNEWLTMTDKVGPTTTEFPDLTYAVETSNDGSKYQWLDIRKTGEQLPFPENFDDPLAYFPKVMLPWPVTFYGKEYDSLYAGQNGLITFDTPEVVPFFPDETIPSEMFKTLLAPYWSFGGFNTYSMPEDELGIFVYSDDDKIVISWEYLIDNFGGIGDPMSAEVIFYRNGTIKFQYKINGSFDFLSTYTLIGVQNGDLSDHVLISQRSNLQHGSGLAYILSPAEKHTIPSGGTYDAQINVDARNVYAGTYNGILNIRTNVPGSELLEKPVNLTVTGEADIASSVPGIDFGAIMADGSLSYSQEFSVKNTGVAPLNLAGMNTDSGSAEYLIEMYSYDSWFGSWYWSDISWIWEWPTIAPGGEARFRITYTPTTAGSISDNINVMSDLDPLVIPVSATVTLPPSLNVQTESVYSSVNLFSDTDTQTVVFDNIEGEGDLNYQLSIDYQRGVPASVSANESLAATTDVKPLSISTQVKAGVSPQSEQGDFNKVLAYENAEDADTFLGYGGAVAFTSGTQFNAGEEGFNLSHIQVLYNALEKSEGTIEYEVRAGGTNIVEATTLTSGSIDYNFSGTQSELGEWLTIAIDEPQVIHPNENFYLVITYPFEIHYPQGTITNAENVPGRYTYKSEGIWYDLQAEDAYPGFGWMVRAAEETHVSGAWLSISAEQNGTVAVGESKEIQLDFIAQNGERGDQQAKLVINTNDPAKGMAKVPVTLHINEAPIFSNVPSLVSVDEASQEVVVIDVHDAEDNIISVEMKDEAPFDLSYELTDNQLTLTFSPGYEDEGSYMMTFIATDEYEAATEIILAVDVAGTNRTPEVINTEGLTYNQSDSFNQLQFADYFTDPDGDEMTFEVESLDDKVAATYVSGDKFIIQVTGEGDTELVLAATDIHGARIEQNITISVSTVLGISDEIVTLMTYPNPVENKVQIVWGQEWSGQVEVEILTINGVVVHAQTVEVDNDLTTEINMGGLVSGVYVLRVTGKDKNVLKRLIKE